MAPVVLMFIFPFDKYFRLVDLHQRVRLRSFNSWFNQLQWFSTKEICMLTRQKLTRLYFP